MDIILFLKKKKIQKPNYTPAMSHHILKKKGWDMPSAVSQRSPLVSEVLDMAAKMRCPCFLVESLIWLEKLVLILLDYPMLLFSRMLKSGMSLKYTI